MKTELADRQSLSDVAIREYGSIEAVFEIASSAGIEVTDELPAGHIIEHTASVVDKQVVRSYQLNDIHPATASGLDGRVFDDTFDLTFG